MKLLIYSMSLLFLLSVTWAAGSRSSEDMTTVAHLHGLSPNEVAVELGDAERCESFLMEEAVGEFRVELQNRYPLTKPENQKVRITEKTWKDGDYVITVWFHSVDGEWLAFHSIRWHKDTDF